jgi:hypothetical protein
MEEIPIFCILLQMRFALAVLLAASSAVAAVPEKGEGTIALFGGGRALLPTNSGYINEQLATHQVIQPGGLASFGYQYDDELHFKIEVGYLWDRYRIVGGDLQVKSIPILLGIDTVLAQGQSFTVYGGGGIGYLLNTGSRHGVDNEANSTAAYIALGIRFQIAGPLAIVLEDRFIYAMAQVDAESTQKLNVGGNLLSLGFMFHFLEPEEKGKPTGR